METVNNKIQILHSDYVKHMDSKDLIHRNSAIADCRIQLIDSWPRKINENQIPHERP